VTTQTVLVTGGAGFIGTRLNARLLDRGYRVRIFDNFYRADRAVLSDLLASDRVELVEGDVRYRAAVDRAMQGVDRVVHLAALCINKSQADPEESLEVNLAGSENVFASAASAGVQRLVFASSASVYGDPEHLPMAEDGPLRPQTPYCIAKLASEHLLGFYQRSRGLSWNAMRYFNVYGPGQKTDAYYTSVVLTFLRRVLDGEPPIIDGKGEQSMDFIHVDDVAEATALALDSDVDGHVFNVGTGLQTTIAQLAHLLVKAVGSDVEPQFRPRDVLVARRAADTAKARELLGFTHRIPVEEGIMDLVKQALDDHGTAR
jgi:UDP-glucose 4-epimerase